MTNINIQAKLDDDMGDPNLNVCSAAVNSSECVRLSSIPEVRVSTCCSISIGLSGSYAGRKKGVRERKAGTRFDLLV